jgi:DNA repair exonuclease SbcCD ATPase subunit
MLQAARAQHRELRNQLERAEDRREEIQNELNSGQNQSPADRAGLEARLKDTDARIASLDQEIAAADQRVATAAAVPGATIEPPRPIIQRNGPPEEAWFLGGMFIFLVMMPIAIAQARRLWRRPAAASNEMPAELTDRLNRLEQAVDAVAVELERVGEGQRYVTRVFTEGRALGAGAAEPLEVRQREAIHQGRP